MFHRIVGQFGGLMTVDAVIRLDIIGVIIGVAIMVVASNHIAEEKRVRK